MSWLAEVIVHIHEAVIPTDVPTRAGKRQSLLLVVKSQTFASSQALRAFLPYIARLA
jgi:hypothetical protein